MEDTPEKLRVSASKWAMSKVRSVKIVRAAASDMNWGGGNENSQNFAFFCILSISRNFDVASYIWGGTMWKLTSWGFRKCGTFWCLELLKRSYRRSESDDSEIFDLSPKISGVKKKSHGHNFEFWLLIWIGPGKYHVRPMFYSYGGLKLKIVAVGFFFDTDLPTGFMHTYKFGAITFKRIVQMTWFFGSTSTIKIYDHLIF